MRRIAQPKNRNKYGNTKVEFDGIKFDSKRERDVYVVLKDMENKGEISGLELQPKYELIPSIKETVIKHLKTKDKPVEKVVQLAITYTGDFRFYKNGVLHVFDVKACKALLPKEYSLKKKMMRYFHGIEIKEIYKIEDIKKVLAM